MHRGSIYNFCWKVVNCLRKMLAPSWEIALQLLKTESDQTLYFFHFISKHINYRAIWPRVKFAYKFMIFTHKDTVAYESCYSVGHYKMRNFICNYMVITCLAIVQSSYYSYFLVHFVKLFIPNCVCLLCKGWFSQWKLQWKCAYISYLDYQCQQIWEICTQFIIIFIFLHLMDLFQVQNEHE